jgi:hypothetical protein
MKTLRFSVVILVAGVFLSAGSVGAADDGKSYAGAGCKRIGGGTYVLGGYGDIYNSGASSMDVTCPLVRDSARIKSATIKVFDRSSAENLTCWVIAESIDNSFFTTDDRPNSTDDVKGTGYFGANVVSLTYPIMSAQYYYYAECTLPASTANGVSHVGSIRIVESS